MNFTKKILKITYHTILDIFKTILSLKKNYNYIVLTPRALCLIFKKILIFDKNRKNFFLQSIRNFNDSCTVHEIFSEESYNLKKFSVEKKINEFYAKKIENKKSLILDCGSNIGSSSAYFLKQYKNSTIVLIEPDKNSFEFSKKNIEDKNVHFLNQGISNVEQQIGFKSNIEDSRASKFSDDSDFKIDCTTVDKILTKFDSSEYFPFLIKIDIEGYEKELFRNNYDWVDKFKVIIIELHDWMLPGQNNSFNFLNAINNIMNNNKKRDLIISGENLILIRIDE